MVQKLKNIYHLLVVFAANIYYGFPSRKLKVIGITGTDGKTTTTSLVYHILKTSGRKVSMISTVYAKIGDKEYDTGLHTTTPRHFAIPDYLSRSAAAGDEYFVLETTSHALDQNSLYGVDFFCGLVTNITHEHLDYHKTYENYVAAKAKMLLQSKHILINHDDGSYSSLSSILKRNNKTYKTFGYQKKSDYSVEIERRLGKKLTEFNRYNYLAAYAVCITLGLSDEDILNALLSYTLPKGRLDIVYDNSFRVVVDFAHTPNSLEKLLQSMRKEAGKGRIIHVFGAAGLRDHAKRPMMGKISANYADSIILTEEDYRTEDPAEIIAEIQKGMGKSANPLVILDRGKAIRAAIEMAKAGDMVIITGKGHEQSLCRGRQEYPWDDKKAVMKAIKEVVAIEA